MSDNPKETLPAIPHREQIASIETFKNEIAKDMTEFKLKVKEQLVPDAFRDFRLQEEKDLEEEKAEFREKWIGRIKTASGPIGVIIGWVAKWLTEGS